MLSDVLYEHGEDLMPITKSRREATSEGGSLIGEKLWYLTRAIFEVRVYYDVAPDTDMNEIIWRAGYAFGRAYTSCQAGDRTDELLHSQLSDMISDINSYVDNYPDIYKRNEWTMSKLAYMYKLIGEIRELLSEKKEAAAVPSELGSVIH